jgi:hypothetical protein
MPRGATAPRRRTALFVVSFIMGSSRESSDDDAPCNGEAIIVRRMRTTTTSARATFVMKGRAAHCRFLVQRSESEARRQIS